MDGRTRRRDAASHRARDARSGLVNLSPGIRLNNLIGRVRRIGASAKLAGAGTRPAAGAGARPFTMAATIPPASAHPAQDALLHELARVQALHADRQRDPALSQALDRLGIWQSRRLGATYADLAAQPRYTDAVAFFQSDLYGGDFARRDADLARVVPLMVRMLPERVIATVALAMEVNALSQELDRLLLAQLPRGAGELTVAKYCRAFRAMGHREQRERQVQLIVDVGNGLDGVVRKPFIHAALVMMRTPARLAGVGVLHDFLERGFDAFHRMHGADDFLATIDRRERALFDRIFAGDDAPFADPREAASAA
jgi:hypothetical protein